MENESGKHYFSLDTDQYTLYPDENEILLRAGMVAKLTGFHTEKCTFYNMATRREEEKDVTVFDLYTSEKMIK